MDHRSSRWITVIDSPHPRERAALDHIRAHLPDHPPFLAMSNFEFIASDGSINEIDLLVVGLQRIFVVEIKSWRGEISGDAGTWTRRLDARQWEEDNPLLLTNRKAKKLRALLQKTGTCKAFALPFLEPLVFLSEGDVVCKLAPHARQGVCLGEAAGGAGFPTIMQVLTGADPGQARRLSGKESGAIARALKKIGVRPSQAARRVADYYLQELLAETDQYQDWRAERVDSASVQRRVRLYPYALAASREARRQQQQAARAEYLLLEGIQHPGVERALDLVEHERGPALLFEYHPEALRLDVWLERHLARLDRGERLALLRQLAETLRFLHARRIYHRALSPASVWVLPPEEGAARLRIGDWQHALGDARETTSSHGDEPFHGIEQDPARLLYLAPEALASPAADPVRLDTFALGAIAYRLFTGQPPAPSPQALERKLADGQGLAVSEVLALPRIRLYRLKGVGQRTVRAIRELSEQLAAQLAVGESAPALEADAGDGDEAGQWPVLSVDQLLKRLTGLQLATSERAVLEAFLGLNETCPPWCGQQEVAETLGVSRADVQQVLERARSRWQRQGWMSALRRQLSQVLQRHGGLMLLDEVADTLVALRGSLAEGAERRRRARALATAAIETEAATAQTAWVLYRGPHRSLLVATGALLAGQPATPPPARANFVERLGARADELAGMDPLLSPVRVLEQLRAVAAPEHNPPLAPERLLALAVGMAREAALSSRQELYPRGMAAERALKLGGGSLFGACHLNAQAVHQRIQSRYPEAEPLPGRPALDRLLEQAGVDLLWEAGADEGRGAYVPVRAGPGGSSSSFHRLPTGGRLTDFGPTVEAAARLETRLQRALAERRFLVLLVAPRHLLRVEAEIAARFPVAVRSLEALLLASMRTVAAERGARWAVVSEADGRDRHGNDWRRLRQLVGLALPAVEQALRDSGQPVLLNYLGMLARYDRLDLLERFREAGARGAGPGLIALVAADEQSHLPMLDGRTIPVIQPAEWARVPESWVENEHRGGGEAGNGGGHSSMGG